MPTANMTEEEEIEGKKQIAAYGFCLRVCGLENLVVRARCTADERNTNKISYNIFFSNLSKYWSV